MFVRARSRFKAALIDLYTALWCLRDFMSMKSINTSPPMFLNRDWRADSSTASEFTARIASSWEPSPLWRPVFTSIAIIASVSSNTM